MPGIAGVVSREPPAVCRRLVSRMVRSMMHEPFYTSGTSAAEDIGVYGGWVIDPASSAAKETTSDHTTGVTVAFAGEIFQESGETAVALYRRLGADSVAHLNGAFSGLILDRPSRRALLFNDRYAAERLYVHHAQAATYFASEAKALLTVLPHLRALDDEAVAEFLALGCTSGRKSLFRGIELLPGASAWVFERNTCRKTRYFEQGEWEHQETLTAPEFDRRFQETFTAVAPRYVRGTDSIGVSLTGGLDTRMIIACLPKASAPPICYTFCGLERDTLDAQLAARLSAICGLEHRVIRIGPDFLANFGRYVDRTIYLTDGCAGALGAHEVYLNAAARELAPIRLTGNFGSEILRSMSTFKALGLAVDLIAPDFRTHVTAAAKVVRPAPGVAFAAFHEVPLSLFGTVAAARSQVVFRTPYLDNDVVSLAYQAPRSVRRSAESALAFVHAADPRLSNVPTDRGVARRRGAFSVFARLLAQATFKLDYLHQEGLPTALMPFDRALDRLDTAGLLGQHKYLPYRVWFRRELAAYVTDVAADASTARLPYFNRRGLATIARDHTSGRRNYLRELNAVLTVAGLQQVLHRLGGSTDGAESNRTELSSLRQADC